MFGSPPQVVEDGWNETPIVGLESIPIMTTSIARRDVRLHRGRDGARQAATVLAEEGRVCLLAHPPEAPHATERQLGARHLAEDPVALEEDVDHGLPDGGRLRSTERLRVLVEEAVSEESDLRHS